MNIVITGTHGFIGARAKEYFPNAIDTPSNLVRNPSNSLSEFIISHNPDIILNCAAISDIGTCEKKPDDSYRANVTLPVNLAKTAKLTGAKLISFSSDQVYTSLESDTPYVEDTPLPTPANVYARHKLEAENKVLDIDPSAVLLRATWMYDMPMYNHQNRGNFLVNTLYALLNNGELSASVFEHRSITYARQVVEYLDKLFTVPGGVYNYGSENLLTMYDTQKALLDALKVEHHIHPVETKRHNLWINCGKIKKLGINFDTTLEGFVRCVNDYNLA